jgi:hypothetical protein
MPRDASGNYTLPVGNPVISGTVIDSTWANDTCADLSDAMGDSLDRAGRGGMLAPMRGVNGTVSAPGVSFTQYSQSGMWVDGSSLHFSYSGVEVDYALDAEVVAVQANLDAHEADVDIHYADAPNDGAPYARQSLGWVASAPFPAATAMLFQQTAAPTGWTKSVAHNDKALRVVSGTVSSGGAVGFTTAFAGAANTGSENATHTHSVTGTTSSVAGTSGRDGGASPLSVSTHSHTFTASVGTESANHQHLQTSRQVLYVDVIIATKD